MSDYWRKLLINNIKYKVKLKMFNGCVPQEYTDKKAAKYSESFMFYFS